MPPGRLPRGLGRTLSVLAALLLLATMVHHVRTAEERFIDQDELEHLNAASFVARGESLYGTFFENHPPLTVAVLQPVVRSSDDPGTIVARGRMLSLAASLGTLLIVGWLGRCLAGWPGASLAPLLLASHTFFAQKSIEVRPDVYSTLLLVLALAVLIRALEHERRSRLALAGALLATGGLFTPKIVYAAAGAALAVLAARGPGPGQLLRLRIRRLLWLGSGVALVSAAATLEMARRGLLAGFVQDCLVVSSRMTIDDPERSRRILTTTSLAQNPAFSLLGLAGLGLLLRPPGLRPAAAVLGFSALSGLLGFAHIRAPLMQVHLTFLPQLAVAGALALVTLLASVARRHPTASWVTLLAGLSACVLPPGFHLHQPQETKAEQLRVIDEVCALTHEESRVLDLWSGLYLTRLPAYRYFFLNSDVLRLLDPAQLERDLHACLDDRRVEVVIAARYYRRLPDTVRDRIEREFEPIESLPIIRHRPAAAPLEDG